MIQININLPKPIFNRGGCNLSFAGLKTAVLKITKEIKTDQEKFDLAASFQKTVIEILNKKTKIAFTEYEKKLRRKRKNLLLQVVLQQIKKLEIC